MWYTFQGRFIETAMNCGSSLKGMFLITINYRFNDVNEFGKSLLE